MRGFFYSERRLNIKELYFPGLLHEIGLIYNNNYQCLSFQQILFFVKLKMLHYFRNFWDLFNVLFCCNLFRSTPLSVYLHKGLYEGAIGCTSLYKLNYFVSLIRH